MEKLKMYNKIMFFISPLIMLFCCHGYIFPDEFFQSPEIMASDILNFSATRTWEWNPEKPARNILFPVMSSGIPFLILKVTNKIFSIELTANILIILPRALMLVVTLLIDGILKAIYSQLMLKDVHQHVGLFLFRTSFVTLLFLPRTFSNTYETLFFALIIFMCQKISMSVNTRSAIHHFALGFVIGIGFFVRITMLAFALLPALSMLFGIYKANVNKNGIVRILKSYTYTGVGFCISCLFCIVCDYVYFSNYEMKVWSITPINLFLYNFNSDTLKQHGLHPRHLNFTVNMFLLFGPIYFLFILLIFKRFTHIFSSNIFSINYQKADNEKNMLVADLFLVFTVIPVLLLSFIAHQEPRYIIPVIIPLVITISISYPQKVIKRLTVPWIVFNLAGLIWFGCLHQAGVVPALSHLNRELKDVKQHTQNHIIFWKTFMPPKHLLAVDKQRDDVFVYDFMGMENLLFSKKLEDIERKLVKKKEELKYINYKIWLNVPSSQHVFIIKLQQQWKLHKVFFPHISMESLPDLTEIVQDIYSLKQYSDLKDMLIDSFSLNLYYKTI